MNNSMKENLVLEADPEPIEIYPHKTALLVVDIQNAVVSKGGTLDLCGMDVSGAQKIIGTCEQIIDVAREAGCRIVYIQHGYSPDLCDAGGENSPNWHKELALILMRNEPSQMGKRFIRGTWDAEVVEELKPNEDDIIVWKQRYSGFAGTNLDIILKAHDVRYLLFIGVATNVCVEATIRDAFSHEYFPILISDAVSNAGPAYTQDATIFNVKFVYGWVTNSNSIIKALRR
jgi:ureidoacrylate peracid hydrolase